MFELMTRKGLARLFFLSFEFSFVGVGEFVLVLGETESATFKLVVCSSKKCLLGGIVAEVQEGCKSLVLLILRGIKILLASFIFLEYFLDGTYPGSISNFIFLFFNIEFTAESIVLTPELFTFVVVGEFEVIIGLFVGDIHIVVFLVGVGVLKLFNSLEISVSIEFESIAEVLLLLNILIFNFGFGFDLVVLVLEYNSIFSLLLLLSLEFNDILSGDIISVEAIFLYIYIFMYLCYISFALLLFCCSVVLLY